ncbi:MAG: M55 family metallopeptidase, partial [Spirochaetota bacterium]
SGDKLLCEGAGNISPGIRTVAVSEGLGNASISIHPVLASRRIAEATKAALGSPSPLLKLPDRFTVNILYRQHNLAHKASYYPGAKQTGPLEVAFKSKDWFDVIRFLYFVL